MKNKKGFTLAEVLITLSIIGIIAAILFPSILANYTERTLKAKRQALFARMSQAMGEMINQFGNYESVKNVEGKTTCSTNPSDCVDDGSALKFINEGLSKVYKIAAVCDNETLSACDIPDEITREDGSTYSIHSNATSFHSYNRQVQIAADSMPFDTDSAAFMTKNGESILLFYNPRCGSKLIPIDGNMHGERAVCINMVYDLNGAKNKPNKVGEDIGFMSVFYNDAPYVATARPLHWNSVKSYEVTQDTLGNDVPGLEVNLSFSEAKAACAALGNNVGLPSLEEAMSMQINRELWAPSDTVVWGNNKDGSHDMHSWFWTSNVQGTGSAWVVILDDPERSIGSTYLEITVRAFNSLNSNTARCVYKD